VLLLFLFAVWLAATLAPKAPHLFWSGLIAGLLMTLRPPFLLLAPFIFLRRRGQWLGASAGLLLGIALPMFWRPDCWTKYFAAMDVNSWLYRSDISPAFPPERFPATIEGMSTDLLAKFADIPYAHFSFHALMHYLGLAPFPALPPLLAIGAAYAFWLWRFRGAAIERLLLGMAIWFFLVDLFLPAYRNTYNDVLMIDIVGLGLVLSDRVPRGLWCCFLALPIGWAVGWFAPERDSLINLPTAFYTLGAILLLFWFNSPATSAKVGKAC